MKAYTLKRKKDTHELHLFEGEMNPSGIGCSFHHLSVCKKTNKDECPTNIFSCATDAKARKECAEAGRAVCGTCVSHLYTTY